MAQLVSRARTTEELGHLCLAAMTVCCGADAAAVWLYEKSSGRLSLAAERGLPEAGRGRPQWEDLFKLPLNSGGALIGVVEAYSNRSGGFGDNQRSSLQLFGALLAGNLHRCQLAAELTEQCVLQVEHERLEELETLWRLTQATAHAVSYPRLFEALLAELDELVPLDAAALLLVAGQPECRVALANAGHRGLVQELALRASAAFEAFGGACPALDPQAVKLVTPAPAAANGPIASGFAVPLTQDGELIGVMYFAALRPESFSERQVRVMHRFAEQASTAMGRVRALVAVEIDRLATIIHSLPQGVVLLDAQGRVLMSNRHGLDRLAALAGATERITRLGEWPLADLVAAAMATGTDLLRREIEQRHADRDSHYAVTLVPVHDQQELVGTVLSIDDVTELRQTEQRLYHDARLGSIGELAAGLAHEMNNPMMIMLGIAEMLGDDEELDESKRGLLRTLHEATLRCAEIVKHLMLFADTQQETGWDALSLEAVVREAMSLVAGQFERDGVSITTTTEPDLPYIQGNEGKLQQLVLSLLRNAHEAMVQSGHGGEIQVRVRVEGEWVVLEVEDNGPGVPPELRTRVFDAFFSTKRDHKGKGLGLSAAHRIAQEHSGEVLLLDGAGPGATFQARFPIWRFH